MDTFQSSFSKMSDRTCVETDMIVMIGDFNIDPLKEDIKSKTLCDVMRMNNLQNIIRGPTCFNSQLPTMIDLCIVSKPRRFGKSLNYNCGFSDWYNLISVPTKIQISRRNPKK